MWKLLLKKAFDPAIVALKKVCTAQLHQKVATYIALDPGKSIYCPFDCFFCTRVIGLWDDVDYCLSSDPRYEVFTRRSVHKACCVAVLDFRDNHVAEEALKRIYHASRVLLLLMELGLPLDVAWPVTAAACWLFAKLNTDARLLL